MAAASTNRSLLIIVIIALVAIAAYAVLTMPDHRTTGQKVGDAIDTIPQGLDKAGRQLESRTPGEKLGDAVKDTGDKIKENTAR